MNPIKVEEMPHHAGLSYVKKDVGESSKAASDYSTIDDATSSSYSNDSKGFMNPYQRNTKGMHFKKTRKVWRKKKCCSRYNEEGCHESTFQMPHSQKSAIEK